VLGLGLGLSLVVAPPPAEPAEWGSSLAEQAIIRRDEFNVPHIFGETDAACAYGMAWVQAEDQAQLVAINLLAAQGRLAEWQGAGALAHDRFVRRHRVPQLIEDRYAALPAVVRGICEGYAAGLNRFFRGHPADFAEILGEVRGQHVAALARLIVLVDFILGQGSYAREFQPAGALVEDPMQSNMWALAPTRTSTGQAMLLINPHLSWAGRHAWYEAHLRSAEGYEMAGAGFFGLPLPVIGHGRRVAWSHTVNAIDLVDLWEERVTGDPPQTYRVEGAQRPVERLELALQYRHEGGLRATNYTEFRTHRGPLVRGEDRRWYSVRSTVDDEVDFLSPWYTMAQAADVPDFIRRLERQRPATFNIMAADTAGNIFYVFNGRPPRHDRPPPRAGVWPGWHADTDPTGEVPFSFLPQLLNPACGFMQNCNSSPYHTALGDNPPRRSGQEAFTHEGMTLRAHSALRLLAVLDRCSWDQFQRAAFDNRCEAAARTLPELVAYGEGLSAEELRAHPDAAQGLAQFRAWDYRATVDAVAMTTFQAWWQRYASGGPVFNVEFDGDALGTPRGLADPARAWRALIRAVQDNRDGLGGVEVPWGQVHGVERGGRWFPLGGGRNELGCLRMIGSDRRGRRWVATGGDGFIMAVHLTEPIQAVSIHPFGNGNDPASPHYVQQTERFCRDEFKPAWFAEEAVIQHARRTYRPQ